MQDPGQDFFEPGTEQRPGRYGEKKKRLRALPMAAVILAAMFALCWFVVFRVRNTEVEILFDAGADPMGEKRWTKDAVLEACGLNGHVNYFTVSEEGIRERLVNNPELKLEDFEKSFPASLSLTVRQRQKTACIEAYGMRYIVDEDGMILDRTDLTDSTYDCLITVTGLNLKNSQAVRGNEIVLGDTRQSDAFRELLSDLRNMDLLYGRLSNGTPYIAYSRLNLSDPEHITFSTSDGLFEINITIDLDSPDTDIRPKLRTMDYVLREVRTDPEARNGGTLEVVAVGEAVLTPK